MTRDPVDELTELLREAGVRATLDPRRNSAHPCYRCNTTSELRYLVTIGTYTRPMGGNLRPGDSIVRPLCQQCREATEPVAPAVGDTVEWARGGGLQRGVVVEINASGCVFVDFSDTDTRGKRVTGTARVWWDPHEVSQLRVVKEPTP